MAGNSLVIKRSGDSTSDSVAIVEEGVKIGQESVADVESFATRNSHSVWPLSRILIFEKEAVVVARKWIKRAQLHPTFAHFFFCVEIEPANIRPDVRYIKHVEFHHACFKKEPSG